MKNFNACRAEKDLLLVKGARHMQSYLLATAEYQERLKRFFAQHRPREGGRRMKKALRIILLLLFIGIFAYSGWNLATYYLAAHQQEQTVSGLRKQLVEEDDSYELNAEGILKRYEKLYAENSDMIGWLSIPDTPIDYPVMQREGDGEYYLHRDFYEKDASAGCLFLEEHCDADKPSTNLIIYGHHMKNGDMFGHLVDYEDHEFYRKHRFFTFDTIHEHRKYQVLSVFRSEAYPEDDTEHFHYYDFIQAEDKADFDTYVKEVTQRSQYVTGVKAEYGEELLYPVHLRLPHRGRPVCSRGKTGQIKTKNAQNLRILGVFMRLLK